MPVTDRKFLSLNSPILSYLFFLKSKDPLVLSHDYSWIVCKLSDQTREAYDKAKVTNIKFWMQIWRHAKNALPDWVFKLLNIDLYNIPLYALSIADILAFQNENLEEQVLCKYERLSFEPNQRTWVGSKLYDFRVQCHRANLIRNYVWTNEALQVSVEPTLINLGSCSAASKNCLTARALFPTGKSHLLSQTGSNGFVRHVGT